MEKNAQLSTLMIGGLLLLCASPCVAIADWYFLATTTSPQSPASVNRPAQLVTAISRNRMKYATNVWTLIVHLDSQRIVLINHLRKRYWEGPVDDYFSTLAQQLQDGQQKAEKMLQVMPLEQSQRLRAFNHADPFDPLMPTLSITVLRSSEQATMRGYQTQKHVVRRNNDPYEETWLATDIHVTTDIDEPKRKAFMDKLQQTRTTPPGAVLTELTEAIATGYPVKTVNMVSQVIKEVIEVQQRALQDEEFAAPGGYAVSALSETMSLR